MLGLLGCKRSSIYESAPLASPCSSRESGGLYLNMVICGYVKERTSPFYMLHYAKCIEQYLGRSSGARWSARTLDIDILLWGGSILNSAALKIPHPELFHRDFVLMPLMEIMHSFYLGKKMFIVKNLINNIQSSHVTRIMENSQC